QLSEGHGLRQQVAVVRDLTHRRRVTQGQLEETGNAGVEDAKTIFTALYFKVRFVTEVDGHHIADKSIELEDIEEELSVGVPCFVGQHEVDVIIQVSPGL